MGRLDGRTALVTGGESGLGKAIAARLAAEGAAVVISDLQRELGERTARELGASTAVRFLDQDVTSEEQWPLVPGQAAELAGPVSILVNNAGIAGRRNRSSARPGPGCRSATCRSRKTSPPGSPSCAQTTPASSPARSSSSTAASSTATPSPRPSRASVICSLT